MKVLITGVAGFIGSNLLGRLLRDGHEVVGVDNLSQSDRSNMRSVLPPGGGDKVLARHSGPVCTVRGGGE